MCTSSFCSVLWLNSLRLRAQASSRIQATAHSARRAAVQKTTAPWRAGAERRGDCLSRMVRRGAGHHGGKEKRLASELFGGTDFPLTGCRFMSWFQ
jgi:hypothetical protein